MSDQRSNRHDYPPFTRAEQTRDNGRHSRLREPGFLPPIDETDPRQPIAPIRGERPSPPEPRYQDMLVPRVFVQPDPHMDDLRARALRMAILRDIFVIMTSLVGLFYLGGLIVRWAAS